MEVICEENFQEFESLILRPNQDRYKMVVESWSSILL